jgi:hypothetical protein
MNRNNKVYIIGGGYSLIHKNFKWLADKNTICVNKSLFFIPNVNYFITMDFSFFRRISSNIHNFKNIKVPKFFIANLANPNLIEKQGRFIDKRGNYIYQLEGFDVIIKSRKQKGIGIEWNDFRNGNNSGYCALQLAILLNYKEIYLLGMDFVTGKQTHFHGGYGESKQKFETKLNGYFEFWKQGLEEIKQKSPNIKIYNCSKTSKLNNIIPYKQL